MERAITGNDVVAPNDPSHFYQYFPIREADPDGEIVDPERNTPEVKRQIPFLASRPQLPKGTKLCCRDCKCRRSFQWYSTDKPPSSNKCVYCRFKKTLRRSKARYKPKGPNASLKRCLLKSLESSLDSWRRWVGKHKHGFIKDTTNEKIRNLLKGYIESHLLSTPASAQGQGDSTGTQTTGGARERKQEGRHASEDATTAPSAANTTRDGDDYEDDIFDDDTFVGRRAETARKRTASTSLTASSHLAKAPRGNITRPSTPSTRDSSIEILEELSTAPCHKF